MIFSDGVGGKLWFDMSEILMRDFWKVNLIWLLSWGLKEECGMVVKLVKMW